MRGFWRPLAIVCLVLLVPILPFVGFGGWLEAKIENWLDPPPSPSVVAVLTVAVLSSDILLPVPSSFVSTFAGAQLGVIVATAASWLGMTLGALAGFLIAKTWGRTVVTRLSSADDLARMDRLGRHYGAWIVIVTRPLPVLAEAAVLLVGMTELAWRWFLPAAMLSNLGIALVYSVLGHLARSQGELPLALAGSIALPLLAATIARRFLR
jgi:uncharacterized membrane protein YdjX (TVP38/TMEM64 family)